ncbi:hypothetical protein [Kitasatospora sp. NPDC059327]|uniref:hypothetical protein n=1 Tax=Kitasatospora sp. NPDC059327 TaxID=3346803 RepID=UPI0036B2154A
MTIPATARRAWSNLPHPVLSAVLEHTGNIHCATPVSEGMNSTVACVVQAKAGTFFVKAAPSDHPYARLDTEAAINPFVVPLSPTLRWRADTHRWNVLAFDYVPGRPADLSPNSPDLPLVAQAVTRLGTLRVPSRLLQPVSKLFPGADAGELAQLDGDAPIHADLNPHNFLILGTAQVVDWASPSRASAWLEVALLLLRLIDAGHTPDAANVWAQQFDCWRTAPEGAVATHAGISAKEWRAAAEGTPRTWIRSLAVAADRWMTFVC